MKPAFSTTAQASSRVTDFIRSRIESGTLGRPSGKRSPCQSGVYLITSSGVKNPCCAEAPGNAPHIIEAQTTAIPMRRIIVFIGCFLLLARLKPRGSWDLHGLGDLFVHLHAEARLIRRSDIAFYDDLAFLDEGLPDFQVVDPMPLAHQVIGN